MKIIENGWMWPEMLLAITMLVLVIIGFSFKPSPKTSTVTHMMCSRVIILTQCTKIEKVYRHTVAPKVISSTCMQIDDNIFCGQVAIERLTEEQCKQYKETTWGIQN